jgi:hypothetical protein
VTKGFIFANLSDKLLFYRIHGKNDTFSKIKEKFLNTLKIRLLMVKAGYEPKINQWIINFFQAILFLIFPEKILKYIYLLSRGILKKEKLLNIIKLTFKNSIKIPKKLIRLAYS